MSDRPAKVSRLRVARPGSPRPSLRNPLGSGRPIRAVLFDLDGTLYRQDQLRRRMAVELLSLLARGPLAAHRSLRVLRAYRHAQEQLRAVPGTPVQPSTQVQMAAQLTGTPVEQVERLVREWMFDRPLKHLPRCRATGVRRLLSFLERSGIELGVFSDYPAAAKLRALEIVGHFSVILCATDPDVGALKPHPRGFERASARWQLDPAEVLFVGDRIDVDAAGAAAAGMPCVIIGARPRVAPPTGTCLVLPTFERLRDVLDDDR
jgi:phosphoglycolate phosphatase/putative hydrolase of the HAD superfamily